MKVTNDGIFPTFHKFFKTGVSMDNNKSIEIGLAIVCGFVWGALAVTVVAKFLANVSEYPPWSITWVFMVVSIIGFLLTVCALIVDVETG